MIFEIFRHEDYGSGDVFGHKIWVDLATAGKIEADEDLGDLSDLMSTRYRDQPVIINGHEFQPTEVTLFVYFSRRPTTDQDNWTADKIITLSLDDDEGDEYTIQGKPAVIWDTVGDLPKLADMSNDERLRWYGSLSELERSQMAHVCGMFIGLSISHPLLLAGDYSALRDFAKMDIVEMFSCGIQQQRRKGPRKPRKFR